MNDLVLKMLNAYTSGEYEDHQLMEKMTAAAKVLLDAALGEPTPQEHEAHRMTVADGYPNTALKNFPFNRKARILGPKTIEERVTLRNHHDALRILQEVWLDDTFKVTLPPEDAEIYRRGLIAEMKEMGHGNQ